MAKFYTQLDDKLKAFIAGQKMFFIATAPNSGRINLSPKGMDSFRCLDEKTVAFLNLTGSGNETAAHVAENGRLTIMFCSFTEQPLTLRLYGQGQAVHPRDKAWATLYAQFTPLLSTRQIIVLNIDSIQTSCGFGVPVYEFVEERNLLLRTAETKGETGIEAYQRKNNQVSIDGLPTKLFLDHTPTE